MMEFVDLEEIGRYLKHCRRRIGELSDELEETRLAVARRDERIHELESLLAERPSARLAPAVRACRSVTR